MLNRTMMGLLLLAGLSGSLFTMFLERVVAPQAALAFAAEPAAPTIQAQQFELVDATGIIRGALRMAPEGTGPELALPDESGHRRAAINQNAEANRVSSSLTQAEPAASVSGPPSAASPA